MIFAAIIIAGFSLVYFFGVNNLQNFYTKIFNSWSLNIPGHSWGDSVGSLRNVNFFGKESSKKFGDVYKMWDGPFNPVVVISSLRVAKEFYKDHLEHIRTPDFLCFGNVCEAMLGKAIGTAYGNEWTNQRKAFKCMMNASFLKSQNEIIDSLCGEWVKDNLGGNELNINDTNTFLQSKKPGLHGEKSSQCNLSNITLKIIARIIYGEVTDEEYKELYKIADYHLSLMPEIGSLSTRYSWFKYLPTETNKKIKIFKNMWYIFNTKMINKANGNCVISEMKKAINSGHSKLGINQIMDNLDELLLFNLDIMYATLGSIFTNLSSHEDWQDLIFKDNGGDNKMLKMFILEVARLYPSIVLTLPEAVPRDTVIGGYNIPEGTIVLVDAFSINTSKEKWDKPDDFDPFRFKNNFNPANRGIHRFGLGPRTCLGQKFAQKIIESLVIQSIKKVKFINNNHTINIKTEGLCFFTPYTIFPVIEIVKRNNITSAELGTQIIIEKGNIICGISINDSYYSSDNIKKTVELFKENNSFFTFIPTLPSIYTYLAKGNNIGKATKKARQNSERLHKWSKEAGETYFDNTDTLPCIRRKNAFYTLNWEGTISNNIDYIISLKKMNELYKMDSHFKNEIELNTRLVIGEEGNLKEGVKFILHELSFLVVSPKILGVEKIAYVYHRPFTILNDLLDGKFNFPKINNVGVYINSVEAAD